jgi:antitoxin component of RelBE/YafQ-DinJ toxin-antitoxin module
VHKPEQKVEIAPKKKRAGKTTVISVSIDRELADEATRVARSLGMSVSFLIRHLLREHIMSNADLTIHREKKQNDSSRSQ